ncbi:MAG: SMI1/KNR4 family protein [Lachnospiraceae bacterium]|nr:SMI1/KNR4 family protein [Lachnospiraceae bacterium]
MNIICQIKKVLDDEDDLELYTRKDKEKVLQAFDRLDVKVSRLVEEFFLNLEGPFWGESLGMLFLDIINDDVNIESETNVCRNIHMFPKQYLVLTEMVADEIIVLDSMNDKVYRVDFEGGDIKLLNGELEEDWNSFEDFLRSYFGLDT